MMWQIESLLKDIEGTYYKDYTHLDQKIDNFEYFSGHLNKKCDYSTTAFVCITQERRSYINRKKVKWQDGNEQIKGRENHFGLIVTEKPIKDPSVTTVQFIVKNSWEFLLQISEKIRNTYENPVVAITGSAGKTSTRMMISHLLKKEKVLENRGNHNVRFAIPLYLSKMVCEPDVLNLEVSVNALNSYDTGSMSLFIQPDIAIVTSIGEAHLSSLKDTVGVAQHKAKIFEGLKSNGTAIINTDIGKKELEILMSAARKRTSDILTYSLYDQTSDAFVVRMKQKRTFCEVVFSFLGQERTMNLTVASAGMIANALGTLLAIWKIKGEIDSYLLGFETFKPLTKILDKKNYFSPGGPTFTFIDDTHNASLPSMKNAIHYFDEIRPFYQGTSILVLGQIADLGNTAKNIHQSLKDLIACARGDYIFGYGEHFKELFDELQQKDEKFQWFATLQELSDQLETLLNEDSLILAKGSVTGSDFHDIDRYIRNIANKKRLKVGSNVYF